MRWCARPPWYSAPAGFTYRLVLGVILFVAMFAAFLFASGWGSRPRDEELTPIEDDDTPFAEEDDRSSVQLAGCFHSLMSTKARLAWLFATAYRSLVASAPQPRTLSFERQEPNLGGRPRRLWRHQDEEELEDEEKTRKTKPPPAPRAEGSTSCCRAQIRQVRTAFGLGPDGAQGVGSSAAQQGRA